MASILTWVILFFSLSIYTCIKRWKYQATLPVSCKTYMQVKKQQLELDMDKGTGSKLGKG